MKRIAWLFLAMAVALCACGPKVEPRPPLRLAIDVWPGYAFAFLAEQKGFFEQNGAAVELVLREGITNSHVLYARGEADGFFDSYPAAIRVHVEGIPTKVVYYADRSSTADGLVGRKDLKSVADLRGRVVSFDEVNSFSHLFVLKLLEKSGIPETGVQFRVVPADQVLEALRRGDIDAGHTWSTAMAQALGEGYRLLATAQEVPAVNLDVLAFRAEVVRDQPDNVLRIVKSLVQARNYLHSHWEESIPLLARAEGMQPEEMAQGIRGVHQPDLQENVAALSDEGSLYESGRIITDFYLERGQLPAAPDLSEILDPTFVRALSAQAPSPR